MKLKYDPKNLDEKTLFDTAMVMQNVKENLAAKSSSLKKYPGCKLLRLKADIHNFENDFFLENYTKPYYDEEDGEEVAYAYTDLRYVEMGIFGKLLGVGVFKGVNPKTKPEEDFAGLGVMTDMPYLYDIVIDEELFNEYYQLVIEVADSKLTIPAELSFTRISVPVIKADDKSYELSPMRSLGNAFEIIDLCLDKYPNSEVTLDTLSEELDISGIKNLTSALKNSHFDQNTGLLRDFVVSSPNAIIVKPSIPLPKKQLKAIVKASTKS
jgi:hypothetical protein